MSPEEQSHIIDLYHRIFNSLTNAPDPIENLNALCRLYEELVPNSRASIMAFDPKALQLNVLAAPSIPNELKNALNGLHPGPFSGSCGNVIYSQKPVFVSNTLSDSRWRDMQEIVRDYDITACWSMPIKNLSDVIVGTFAISSFTTRGPDEFQIKILEIGANTAGLIMLRMQEAQTSFVLNAALEATSDTVMMADANGIIYWVNSAFSIMTGYNKTSIIGSTPQILHGPKTDPETKWQIREAIKHGRPFRGEILYYHKNGSTIWNDLTISPVYDSKGELLRFFGVHRDITAMRALREQVDRMAYNDSLTTLPNRHALSAYLTRVLSRAKTLNTEVIVGVLDIDNFKPINDTWGHAAGDSLLQVFSQRLQGAIRENDLVARVGGDEFVFVLDKFDHFDDLSSLLCRIHATVEYPFELPGNANVQVGISMGLSRYPNDGDDGDLLLRHADIALYNSKAAKDERDTWWSFWSITS